MQAFLAGFLFCRSLIAAIGAQNAFVLRQGLVRQHVLAVVLFCAVSDAMLISVGVFGAGALSGRAGWLMPVLRWGGAAFLVLYGLRAFVSAWSGASALRASGGAGQGLPRTLLALAALTWLNPHVYLDTVVLMGAVSARWPDKHGFAAGAALASLSFFAALGFGARLLAPVFARPVAWRVLDLGVAVVMWMIAASLVL